MTTTDNPVRNGVDTATLEPSQVSLVANVRDLPAIVEKLPVNFQGSFLELLKEAHPLEHRDIVINLLKVSQGKFTTECINFLMEMDKMKEAAAVARAYLDRMAAWPAYPFRPDPSIDFYEPLRRADDLLAYLKSRKLA